jgi:hypothetical protein
MAGDKLAGNRVNPTIEGGYRDLLCGVSRGRMREILSPEIEGHSICLPASIGQARDWKRPASRAGQPEELQAV